MNRLTGVGAAVAVLLSTTIVRAQEIPVEPGGLELRFGIAERLEYGRNLSLDVPDPGNGFIASTILSFGLSSETRTQSINLDAVTGLRLQDLPNIDDNFDIGDARLDFGYTREAANAGLSLDAEYLRFDIGFLRSLSDFEDEDGFIILPADFADLTGDGTRNDFSYGFSLDGGRQSLIGYNLSLRASGLRYTDTTDPGLDDNDRIDGRFGLSFAFSQRTTGRLDYDLERFTDDSPDEIDRDGNTITFGLLHEVSSTTRFDAALGYADIEETREINGDRDVSGIVGNLGVERDVPDGSYLARYETTREIAGRLDRLFVGRNREIPDGAFGFTLGAARQSGGSVDAIGSLLFDREYGPDTLRVRLSRDILFDDEDDYFAATVVDVGYIWGITPLSQFALRGTYALSEETDTSSQVEFSNVSAVYSHDLTREWQFNAGLDYRVRDEDGVGRATSPMVFVSIGKNIVWRP